MTRSGVVVKKWTRKEIVILEKLAGTISAPKIALQLGRSRDSVKAKIQHLKLPQFEYRIPRTETPTQTPSLPENKEVALRKTGKEARPPLRQVEVHITEGEIEWCPVCHSPVSNWAEHYQRQGHRRPA